MRRLPIHLAAVGRSQSRKHLDGRCPGDLVPHRRRRLDGEDAEVEPVAEGSGELTGAGADVDQRHPLRGAQVPSYRLAPLREPVAWDLADRLERCRGLLVIADPGHVRAPCWATFLILSWSSSWVGALEPRVLCRRVRLYQAIYLTIARRAMARVGQA